MKTRNIQLDVAKGLCLILMIGGHTKGIDPGLHHFIYSFHMPAFFVIAGMTYMESQSPKTDLVWSKFKRLIIPAWIFGAINGLPFLMRLLRGVIDKSEFFHRFIGTFTGAAQVNDTFNCTPLWFLYAVFLVYLFEIVTSRLLQPRTRFALLLAILLLLFINPWAYQAFAPMQLKYALTGILFFQVGVLLKERMNPPQSGHHYFLLSISFIVWIGLASFAPTVQLNSGFLGTGGQILLSFFAALAGVFFIIQLAHILSDLPYLPLLAQISLPIVGLNYLVEQRLNPYIEGMALFVIEAMILILIASLTVKTGPVGRLLNGRI
ncbi:acyltransferase family protein [Herbaspirillum frisingense]|uniref:acyltransferase family protein n=1 Tax=Herbaspirillum frisingense TaxID=92645 RepID=UPI00160119B2|nr:acyltransferase family protein [Herbaspirillum frisingense]QNB07240.1 acyltransferase family protein [Herbaspirillum frisingense]